MYSIPRDNYHSPKMRWSKEEDALLIRLVAENGTNRWSFVANKIHGRTSKQCRERWFTNLSPDINCKPWTAEEDTTLIQLHSQLGNKWAQMKPMFNGRTGTAIKNRWVWLCKHKIPDIIEKFTTPKELPAKPIDDTIKDELDYYFSTECDAIESLFVPF
ncbi:Myb-like DNA-binding domain containing protein [Trichomonas vaginalis G3]|uniref:Myb-like DNA-binding domain containing protein n=1 Tax=Trichomonas vaginalis (strain ATCC PRA-98 / G3) TaxID=412133 RepID=A2FYK6_TRIV3|nr:RNA polymerase II transcription regulator recruiting protein [Trichomonas vaginalis G3]EAX90010.1 Myb-like DNA-binding domain containing protein [Trichomonas vaginalis G3]KAI5532072.1 RNA polymerase II transcription regulator recruiting protein [Trichomonas vaginalis G3]|eukprot:XP_001302940.1 Myb-like DNA-binding domain containing protein [Trichomonas vaginalis G3]